MCVLCVYLCLELARASVCVQACVCVLVNACACGRTCAQVFMVFACDELKRDSPLRQRLHAMMLWQAVLIITHCLVRGAAQCAAAAPRWLVPPIISKSGCADQHFPESLSHTPFPPLPSDWAASLLIPQKDSTVNSHITAVSLFWVSTVSTLEIF